MSESGIIVVGSLNPEKECQDRVRVLGPDGVCQALRATDYKDPPKILGTVYTGVSEDFQRGFSLLQGVSRLRRMTWGSWNCCQN